MHPDIECIRLLQYCRAAPISNMSAEMSDNVVKDIAQEQVREMSEANGLVIYDGHDIKDMARLGKAQVCRAQLLMYHG